MPLTSASNRRTINMTVMIQATRDHSLVFPTNKATYEDSDRLFACKTFTPTHECVHVGYMWECWHRHISRQQEIDSMIVGTQLSSDEDRDKFFFFFKNQYMQRPSKQDGDGGYRYETDSNISLSDFWRHRGSVGVTSSYSSLCFFEQSP